MDLGRPLGCCDETAIKRKCDFGVIGIFAPARIIILKQRATKGSEFKSFSCEDICKIIFMLSEIAITPSNFEIESSSFGFSLNTVF